MRGLALLLPLLACGCLDFSFLDEADGGPLDALPATADEAAPADDLEENPPDEATEEPDATAEADAATDGGADEDASAEPDLAEPDLAEPDLWSADQTACPAGQKRCDELCVADDDPATGCAALGCSPCALQSATAVCAMGACAIGECKAGTADCDGDPSNGCEADTAGDPKTCGGCKKACSASGVPTPACSAGLCTGACAAGRGDCNADKLGDGCETDLATDAQSCGACGAKCSFANAGASCVDGKCAMGACSMGFGDCDKKADTGCEASVATDDANCGACGAPCGVGSTCVGGACKLRAGQVCAVAADCASGACVDLRCAGMSCAGLAADCGPAGDEACCRAKEIPGLTYNRLNDATFPATLTGFSLDRFEVTVGRFRKFVEAGGGTAASAPAQDAGLAKGLAGTGWDKAWNASLAKDKTALKSALTCGAGGGSWTSGAGGSEGKPITCVTWYEAFAFCVWDGGRLPTEAEWNAAAAGGEEQRLYPWPGDALADTHAVYAPSPLKPVGSRSPAGDGRWGHADLGGNVSEWTFDQGGDLPLPCSDCANTTAMPNRVRRGGAYSQDGAQVATTHRPASQPATSRSEDVGIRCAR